MAIDIERDADESVEEGKQIANKGVDTAKDVKKASQKAKDFLDNKKDAPDSKVGKGNAPSGPSSAAGKGRKPAENGKEAAKQAKEAAEQAAKAAKKGADAAAKAGSEVAADTVRAGAAVASMGSSEAVAAPLDGARRTAGAAKDTAKAGKEAVDKAKDAAQKIKRQAESASESVDEGVKITKIMLILLLIGSIVMPGVISPISLLSYNSLNAYNYESNHEAYENGTKKTDSLGEKILKFFHLKEDDEEDLAANAFENAETYDDIMNGYTQIIYEYLNDSIESQKADVANNLEFEVNGETVVADYDLTLANYQAQGNPFASANIASIMAAYSVSQGSIETETLSKFKKALKKAEPHMLHVSYSVVDENGNLYQERVVDPYYIYKYDVTKKDVSGQGYLDYLKNFPEGHEAIKNVCLESLDADISRLQGQITAQQQIIGGASKTVEDKKATQSAVKAANRAISAAQGQIAAINVALAGYQLERDNIANGIVQPNLGMVNPSNIGNHTVDVYTVQKDEKGNPAVDHAIQTAEGQEDALYVLYEGSDEEDADIFANTYAYAGTQFIVPKMKDVTYAQVTFTPYNSADVFAMFDIDPKATYKPSAKTNHPITNEQMYNMYYDTLSNITSMAIFTADSVLSQNCTLTTEEVETYVEIAQKSGAHQALVSQNRLQLVKTALGMTGAIYYEWGGKPRQAGWDEEWWTPITDGYKGLDCSGFVKWAQWTALDQGYSDLNGTGGISDHCTVIGKGDLMPGDFGVLFLGGSSSTATNHTGIFLGYDEDGNMLWVHCNGSDRTVSVGTQNFRVFLRNPAANIDGSERWTNESALYGSPEGNRDQRYVIAKSLRGEYGADDVGFQACVEAACNKVLLRNLPVSMESLYNEIISAYGGNYCDAYNQTFIKGTMTPPEPTAAHYAIINKVIAGQRDYIKDTRVAYWRSKGSDVPPKMSLYQQIPEKKGNKFLYYN